MAVWIVTTVGVMSLLIWALLFTLFVLYSIKWEGWQCEWRPFSVYGVYSLLYFLHSKYDGEQFPLLWKMLHKDEGLLRMKVTFHLEKLTSGLQEDEGLRDFRLQLLCSIMSKKRFCSWLWAIQIWERYSLRQGHFQFLDCSKDFFSNMLNIQILHFIQQLLKVKHISYSESRFKTSGWAFLR